MTNAASSVSPPPYAYLDGASSEPLHPAALAVLQPATEQGYADPRRLHGPGRNARLLLDNAREVVADVLGVRRDEVIFTGSGTEAVHLGLLGLARRGIAYAAVEHQAVSEAAAWSGLANVEVGVDDLGRVDLDALGKAARGGSVDVLAVQQANHEVGTIQPLAEVRALAEETSISLFVDAGASMGRLPLPVGDVVTGSARKWGGPGGVGVLVVRKRARWRRPFPGDPWDRSEHGFSNVPGALAAAAALQAVAGEREEVNRRQHELIDLVRSRVATIPDIDVVGDPDERLPHLVTFSFLYVDGEALVTELDKQGFGVASGSACTASTLEPSHVLAAMGALTHGNLRLSLTREAGREEVERFLDVLPDTVERIRREAGMA